MPELNASGTSVQRLFVAATHTRRKPPIEETGIALRQWRILSKHESTPTSTDLGPVIAFVANS